MANHGKEKATAFWVQHNPPLGQEFLFCKWIHTHTYYKVAVLCSNPLTKNQCEPLQHLVKLHRSHTQTYTTQGKSQTVIRWWLKLLSASGCLLAWDWHTRNWHKKSHSMPEVTWQTTNQEVTLTNPVIIELSSNFSFVQSRCFFALEKLLMQLRRAIELTAYQNNTHTHPFNSPLSRTTQVRRYQKVNQSGFYWSKRQWVAVASAGPYASLHLASDR